MTWRAAAALLGCALAACGGGPAAESLQPGTACSHCRMTVADARLASQLTAEGEEPRFFDDLGCLAAYLSAHAAPRGSHIYVADHRSGEWVDAAVAVFGRDDALATPMNSHLFAHASASSRGSDTSVHAVQTLTAADVLGPHAVPGGDHAR